MYMKQHKKVILTDGDASTLTIMKANMEMNKVQAAPPPLSLPPLSSWSAEMRSSTPRSCATFTLASSAPPPSPWPRDMRQDIKIILWYVLQSLWRRQRQRQHQACGKC